MGKKKIETKISKNEQQLLDGIETVNKHQLFGRLRIGTSVVPKRINTSHLLFRTKNR